MTFLYWMSEISLLGTRFEVVFEFVFVLMGWSLLSSVLRRFQIYCAPPNLGITRTWICRLNFGQKLIFSGLRFFNENEMSDSGPPAGCPSRRRCAQDFYVLKKSIDLSRVWTPNLWSRGEHVTPRLPRSTRCEVAFLPINRVVSSLNHLDIPLLS